MLSQGFWGVRAKTDKDKGPVLLYGHIKLVLIVSIQVGISAIIG